RLSGLNIVVTVKEDRGLAGSFERFRIDERMQSGRNDLNGFKSGYFEFIGNPLCGSFDVGFVFALGADARDAEKFAELFEVRVAATFDKFSKVHRGRYESRSF